MSDFWDQEAIPRKWIGGVGGHYQTNSEAQAEEMARLRIDLAATKTVLVSRDEDLAALTADAKTVSAALERLLASADVSSDLETEWECAVKQGRDAASIARARGWL